MSPRSIKRTRKTLQLTQRAAAALVHVSPNTWARWERGESKPRGLLHRRLITELPLAARPRRSNHDLIQPRTALPPRSPATFRSTGATLLNHLVALNGRGGTGLKRRVRKNPLNSRPTPAVPKQAKKFRSTGASLLKFVGTWVGDDAERCLDLVYATRGLAKF